MIEKYLNRTDFSSYDDMKKNLSLNIPENFNFAYDVLDKWAETDPDKKALIWCDDKEEKTITFGEMKELSDRLANSFSDMGIEKNDIVALVLKRRWEYWVSVMALTKIGACVMPVNHLMMKKDIIYRFNLCEVKTVIAGPRKEFLAEMEKAVPKCPYLKNKIIAGTEREGWIDFDELLKKGSPVWKRPYLNDNKDVMMLYFTSGTTGHPKPLCHNYLYPIAHIITGRYMHCDEENKVDWTIADTGWAKASFGKLYGQWFCGSAVLTYDYERFNGDSVLKFIEKYKVNSFCAPPTVYKYFLKCELSEYDLSSVKCASSMGEPLPPEVFRQFKEKTGLEIRESFGQTESATLIGMFEGVEIKEGSIGKASPIYDICLIGEDNKPVSDGCEGKIAVKLGEKTKEGYEFPLWDKYTDYPLGLFGAYVEDTEKNSKIFTDKYYFTGDLAKRDSEGYYYFLSRDDDVIKTSGYRVGPFEVESVIAEHNAVSECAVIGIPDVQRGQIIKAFIILKEGFEPKDDLAEEIRQYVKNNTAPYKYPRVIEFVNDFPRTFSGKVKRKDLK